MKPRMSDEDLARVQETRNRLTKAFRKLRKANLVARQKYMCCNSCAHAMLADECEDKGAQGMVFYSKQNDIVSDDGQRLRSLYVHFAAASVPGVKPAKIGALAVKIFQEEGLQVFWNRKPGQCIEIRP